MDRRRILAVWALASTWAGSAAAELSPRALARAAQTPESRCANRLCQDVTDESESATGSAAEADEPPPFSLALGVGAAWLRSRMEDVQFAQTVAEGGPGNGSVDGPPTHSEGFVIDEGVGTAPLSDPAYHDENVAAYPTLSLTLDLQQPLVALGAVNLRLAERFSVVAAPRVPGEDLSLFGGFADVVLGAHGAGFPIQVGVGPTLGAMDVRSEHSSWGESVLVGVLGIVRVELPGVPGTLDVVVRGTRLLASPEAASYRDAQLAYSIPL